MNINFCNATLFIKLGALVLRLFKINND